MPALMEQGGHVGHVAPEVAVAFSETPEAMLWFASLPNGTRRRMHREHAGDDEDSRQRARVRAIARRLADP